MATHRRDGAVLTFLHYQTSLLVSETEALYYLQGFFPHITVTVPVCLLFMPSMCVAVYCWTEFVCTVLQVSAVPPFVGPVTIRTLPQRIDECSVRKVHRRSTAAALAALPEEAYAIIAGPGRQSDCLTAKINLSSLAIQEFVLTAG